MNNLEKYRNAYSVIEPSADFTSKVLKEAEKMNQMSHSKGVFEGFRRNKGVAVFKRVVLFAVVMMILSVSSVFAVSKGWDVEIAKAFGVSTMMKDLEDGYVNIGASDTQGGITVNVNQAIGDDTSQWIQIDTNIDFEEDETNSVDYLPEKTILQVSNLVGTAEIDGGFSMQCFNHHGKVSYWLFPTGYKGINKARLKLTISGIKRTVTDENGKIIVEKSIDDSTFEMRWKNVYDTHVRAFDLDEEVKCKLDEDDQDGDRLVECKLTKVKLTPITLYMEGTTDDESIAKDYLGGLAPQVNKVKLTDDSIVEFDNGEASYAFDGGAHGRFNAYITLVSYNQFTEREESINGNKVKSIFVGDTEIRLEK